MKYLKLFEYYNQLETELDKYNIKNYTINSDGSIDVNHNVSLTYRKLTEIPFQFGKVDGFFRCRNNKLVSLKGSPDYVGGGFYCNDNQLTSLEYAPKYVGGNFYCSYNNQLISLEYAPKYVGDHFYCDNNDIRYIPPDLDIEGNFYISGNPIDIIFNHNIPRKQILEELTIYNPISKDGLTVYKTKLKEMYQQLRLSNNFNNDINSLSKYYKIV